MVTQDEFDAWCRAAPGLERGADGQWAAATDVGPVSFPDEAHADLATLEDGSYWFAHRNAVIASVVAQHPPAGPIFDVGGGNGFVSMGLNQAGYDSIVVEPGASGVAQARRRGLQTIRANFAALDAPPGSIAAVGLFDVLEHIEDAAATLAGIARSLRPGGMIYVAVPAYSLLWSIQDGYGGHFRRYTLGQLRQDLSQAGFETVFGTYFFSILVAPLFLFRTLPSALRLRRSEHAAKSGAEEHKLPAGSAGRLLMRSFAWEDQWIAAARSVPFGTSCIVAARKRSGR